MQRFARAFAAEMARGQIRRRSPTRFWRFTSSIAATIAKLPELLR
jgi:hypothetical protein